jgi:hypothetical protein
MVIKNGETSQIQPFDYAYEDRIEIFQKTELLLLTLFSQFHLQPLRVGSIKG